MSLRFVGKVPPLWDSINVLTIITQGLRPGLCRSVALTGLIYVITTNQLLGYFDAVALNLEGGICKLAFILSNFASQLHIN